MAKQRSRRLRKKLHLGEFQEFGFAFKARIQTGTQEEAFVNALLGEVIDPRGLEFGGWAAGGFVSRAGKGSATDDDRLAVIDWLRSRPEVASAQVSALLDAWNTVFVPDELMPQIKG